MRFEDVKNAGVHDLVQRHLVHVIIEEGVLSGWLHSTTRANYGVFGIIIKRKCSAKDDSKSSLAKNNRSTNTHSALVGNWKKRTRNSGAKNEREEQKEEVKMVMDVYCCMSIHR
jgi:hypothetical protein